MNIVDVKNINRVFRDLMMQKDNLKTKFSKIKDHIDRYCE